MYLENNKLNAIEKFLNKMLSKTYPMITHIDIGNPFLNGEYILNIYTSIPETVTLENYWVNDYWYDKDGGNNVVLDFHWMNDVILPKLLKYFGLTDLSFNREIRIFNIKGDLVIITT